jgi:hypothetical protein
LGILAYAQRFSCVGVIVPKIIEALAGEVVMVKAKSPPQNNRHRMRRSGKRLRLFDNMAFMG